MKDPTSQLRSATRRAKSDVANKLVSMFLHELSRRISQTWQMAADGEEYEYRVGLHVPGTVLVACRRCNNEKRRDDSLLVLSLAKSGWESFLSHDGSRCSPTCRTCLYWKGIWEDEADRRVRLSENLQRLRLFRSSFLEFEQILPSLIDTMPALLTKLYADCQAFAETEMGSLLDRFEKMSSGRS